MRWRTIFTVLILFLFLLPVNAKRKKGVATKVLTDRVLSENDKSLFDYYFSEAINARLQNRYDVAYDLLQHCLQIDSLNAQTWFEISVFYNNMKRVDLGLEAMNKACTLDPSNDWYSMALANLYINLKMYDRAITLYESLIKSRPEDEMLHYYLATLYNQNNRDQEALQEFDKVESLIGKNEQVSVDKFKIYQKIGKPSRAIREIQDLVKANPFNVEMLLLLGDCWMEQGNKKEAFSAYQQARTLDLPNPLVALSLADYYNAVGDSLEARKQLLSALTNPETEVQTKLEILTPILAESLQTGDSTRIPELFTILLNQHPNDFSLRDFHVEYLLEKGMKKEAKAELRTTLDINPNQLDAWKRLLQLCAESENQPEIRSVCAQALTYFPKESIFWFYQGLSFYPEHDGSSSSADYNRALESLQKAVEVIKADDKSFLSRIYGLMGDIYFSLKDRKKAYEYYDKSLTAQPGNIMVLNNFAYYLSEEEGSDLYKAEKMSRLTIDADPKNPTFLDTYAWIFFKQGKYGLAKIYIERAVANEQNPSSIILEHYGDILWFNEEKDAALEQWKKAIKLENPSAELLEKVENEKYFQSITNTP
jgi:tetratricopeptide (TPR) repeat protein